MSLYPLDTSGVNPANTVYNEIHTISQIDGVSKNYIVPDFAPFFGNNLTVVDLDTGRILEPEKDYDFGHRFEGAYNVIAKDVYGSFFLVDSNYTGRLRLKYNTLGWDFVDDTTMAIENGLASLAYLKNVLWEDIVNKLPEWPASAHDHPVTGVEGVEQFLAIMQQIAEGVTGQVGSIHMDDIIDMDTAFLVPMIAGLNNIAAELRVKAWSMNTYWEQAVSNGDNDLGSVYAGQWFSTGLRLTVQNQGTYLMDWSVPGRIIDTQAIGGVQPNNHVSFRYAIRKTNGDFGTVSTSYNKGAMAHLTAGMVIELQAKVRANAAHFFISRADEAGTFTALRVGN